MKSAIQKISNQILQIAYLLAGQNPGASESELTAKVMAKILVRNHVKLSDIRKFYIEEVEIYLKELENEHPSTITRRSTEKITRAV